MRRHDSRGSVGKLAGLILLGLSLPEVASACSVCYGEPDSPAARGLTWAILTLGLVVAVVLSGVVVFFVQANRNSSSAEELNRGDLS